ncbi:hypothetical protein DHEL01_v210865 [Diaporthe helianthi]|uniref:Uncharacterized protein n=1 Tax=Diaporthe helianthi TaxID=158607 RepID=A0A2P5HKG6_DIAHE|nr:hypothetical protein DHEL01_v210865 [Diaporthe helianthi]
MKLLLATLALAIYAQASPKANPQRGDALQMNIVLQVDKESQQSSTEVWTIDRSTRLESSCSTGITSGAFAAHPITFDVDEDGSGDVTIGLSSYKVHHDPEYSGGIVCTRLHSPADVIVSCIAPVPQDVSLEPLEQSGHDQCFSSGRNNLLDVLTSLEGGSEILSEDAFEEKHNTTSQASLDISDIKKLLNYEEGNNNVEKRQGPQCDKIRSFTRKVGGGNPHQNPMNVQLSDEMRCNPGRTCGISATTGTSYAVGWSANANAFGWISGGFAVTKTEMTGNNYVCNGNPGDRLCLWKNQGQTAYTVRNWISTPCQAESPVGNPYVIGPLTRTTAVVTSTVCMGPAARGVTAGWIPTPTHPVLQRMISYVVRGLKSHGKIAGNAGQEVVTHLVVFRRHVSPR